MQESEIRTLLEEVEQRIKRVLKGEAEDDGIELAAALDEFDATAVDDMSKLAALLREKLEGERWIPVSERLPELGQMCLVVWGGHVQHCAYVYAGKSFQLPESIGACIGGEDMPADEATAWRPLPTAPEVKA